ncbi:MAG: Hpt domain-containing protein [Elusimicrobia bacterium]|nr:Hpt domain-containing protein [Elusimicrobiota bacterium]
METDDALLQEFIRESVDNIALAEKALAQLAADPADPKAGTPVFRAVHTLAGTAGFFGFERLGLLAHEGERFLGPWRDGVPPSLERRNLAAELLDAIRGAVSRVAAGGPEGPEDFKALRARLRTAALAEA